tara:strand:- start:567 stop:1427 length:861 start_codon:yes stop_codon:yes gene_type:complete
MKRREFIQKSSAAGLVGTVGLLNVQAVEDDPLPEFRGRIYKSVKFGGRVNLDRLKKLKELGYDGVEGSAPGMDLVGLKKACSEFGLPMHGVVYNKHWKMRLSSPNEEVRDIGRKGLEDAIRESKAVGGSSVLLVPGAVKGKDESHDHVWERSITEIRKVLPLASHLGIRILIETVWNGFCYKPEQFRDYLDAIDNPWVGAYYDIGNMQKFAPSHEWIRVLGSRIVKLDVKDWGVKNGFCPLGQGDVDWMQVRRELSKIDFSGWVTREGSDGGDDKTAALMNKLLRL